MSAHLLLTSITCLYIYQSYEYM